MRGFVYLGEEVYSCRSIYFLCRLYLDLQEIVGFSEMGFCTLSK